MFSVLGQKRWPQQMGYVKQMSQSSLHQRDVKICSRTRSLSPFLPEISSQIWHLTLPSASCFIKHFLNLPTPLSTITALYSLTPDHFISNISPLYQHIPDKTMRGAVGRAEDREDVEAGMLYEQQKPNYCQSDFSFTAQLLDKLQLVPFTMRQGTA